MIILKTNREILVPENEDQALEALERNSVELAVTDSSEFAARGKEVSPATLFVPVTGFVAAERVRDDARARKENGQQAHGRGSNVVSLVRPGAQSLERGLTEVVEELESKMVLDAMARTGNNQVRAAELLKITRGALQYKLKKYVKAEAA